MGKIAGKIFLTSKKHHSNQSPAASSRCLQGTIPFHFITFQHTSPPPLKPAKSGPVALNMVSVDFMTLHDSVGIVDGTHGSINRYHQLTTKITLHGTK